MRWLSILLVPNAVLATAFDCREYDCVGPMTRLNLVLPSGLAIPQPVPNPVLEPGLTIPPLIFAPRFVNLAGDVLGRVSGDPRFSWFLSDGARTTLWTIPAAEPRVLALGDGRTVFFEEGPGTLYTINANLNRAVGIQGRERYFSGVSRVSPDGFEFGFNTVLEISQRGDAILARGPKRTILGALVELDVTYLVSSSVKPDRIPEPAPLASTAAGLAALLTLASRRAKRAATR